MIKRMEFTEFENRRIEKAVNAFLEKRRPPADLRQQLDLGFRLEGQSLMLFEIRPAWKDPHRFMECPTAKATFVQARKVWRVFWQRADMKWHGYQPVRRLRPSRNSWPWLSRMKTTVSGVSAYG